MLQVCHNGGIPRSIVINTIFSFVRDTYIVRNCDVSELIVIHVLHVIPKWWVDQ
jgi:hypothetical protein